MLRTLLALQVSNTEQQLAHHTGSVDTRVALAVIDVRPTVWVSKSHHTRACVAIDDVLWNSFHKREQKTKLCNHLWSKMVADLPHAQTT